MKVLFLSQGRRVEDHPGWERSLHQLKHEGVIEDYLNIPWQGYGETYGWAAFYQHVVKTVQEGRFDIVYFHYFHRKDVPSPEACLKALQALPSKPTIITSAGDGFSDDWHSPDYPRCFKIASRFADITFSTQMGRAADKMMSWGARRVVYLPNSLCPVRFRSSSVDPAVHQFEYDVVMIASKNKGQWYHPLSRNFRMARLRTELVSALTDHFGRRFGLFGRGWKGLISNQGPTPFAEQQKTFQRGRVLVGGNPYSFSDYYSSNRVFFELASGVPTVELRVSRLDHVLRDGDQIYFADDVSGVIAKVEELLKADPVELYAKAARAAQEISERHTQYHRMKFKIETAIRYRETGRLNVDFPFFLPEVDLEEERRYAIREK